MSKKGHQRSVESVRYKGWCIRDLRWDLVDMICVGAIHFDRVRGKFGIQAEGTIQVRSNELGVHSPLRENPVERLACGNIDH